MKSKNRFFHVAEEASREFGHFDTPIKHHNAMVAREAFREIIRCFLNNSSPDNLKPLAKLFQKYFKNTTENLAQNSFLKAFFQARWDGYCAIQTVGGKVVIER